VNKILGSKELGWKWHFFKCLVRRKWYLWRHGIRVDLHHSMLPDLGKGPYVDVTRKGNYIDIHDHCDKENPFTIRLIPYGPNHGVMVEYVYPDGHSGWRTSCDARKFCEIGMGVQEAKEYKEPPKRKKGDPLPVPCTPYESTQGTPSE